MLRAQHALADGQHRAMFLLRLGVFALIIQGVGQIVAARQSIAMLWPQHPLLDGQHRAMLRFRLSILALGIQGDGQIVPAAQRLGMLRAERFR